MVRMHRAVAVAEADGPLAGLRLLDGLELPGHRLPAARGRCCAGAATGGRAGGVRRRDRPVRERRGARHLTERRASLEQRRGWAEARRTHVEWRTHAPGIARQDHGGMSTVIATRTVATPAQLDWLTGELAAWRAAGILDEGRPPRSSAGYHPGRR